MDRTGSVRVLVLAAFALCFAAQYLFTGEAFTRSHDTAAGPMELRHVAGLALLGLAVGLVVVADRRRGSAPAPAVPEEGEDGFVRRMRIPALLAIAAALVAFTAVLRGGESPAVRIAWVAGILVFFVPLVREARRGPPRPAAPWTDVAAVVLLTAAGFWLRWARLTELPSDVHPDVALMGNVTLDMIRSGDARWFGIAASGHLLSSHQILAAAMRVFGTNHYGLGMHSVLAGTATLPLVFLLARDVFGRSAALLGTAMLAMNYTHIHFSRTLFGPLSTCLVTAGVYLLVRGLVTGAPAWFGYAGGVLAAALFTYYSARIGPLVAGVALVVEAARGRVFTRAGLARWGAFLAGSFVVFAPMLGFAFREPRAFVGRASVVTLLDPEVRRHSMEKYDANDIVEVVLEQARRTALGFHLYGDESPHFTFRRPAVGALTAALLVLGAGFSLRRLRQTPVFLLWTWVGLTALLGGVLTSDPPYWPHLNILLPAVAILAGLGGERVASAVAAGRRRLKVAAVAAVSVLVFASGVHGWRVYTQFESDSAGPAMRAARYLHGLPQETRVYLVSDALDWDDDVFRFFDQGMTGQDETVGTLLDPERRIDPPAVILLDDQLEALPLIAARHPGGRVRELRQPNVAEPVMVAYELFAADRPAASAGR